MNEQWQELKETIIEMRDNDGTLTQQEVCKFLANLMNVLEKQMSGSENEKDVLDKIRAKFISLYPKNYAGEPELSGCNCVFSLNKILQIIDKYNTESEE